MRVVNNQRLEASFAAYCVGGVSFQKLDWYGSGLQDSSRVRLAIAIVDGITSLVQIKYDLLAEFYYKFNLGLIAD